MKQNKYDDTIFFDGFQMSGQPQQTGRLAFSNNDYL